MKLKIVHDTPLNCEQSLAAAKNIIAQLEGITADQIEGHQNQSLASAGDSAKSFWEKSIWTK